MANRAQALQEIFESLHGLKRELTHGHHGPVAKAPSVTGMQWLVIDHLSRERMVSIKDVRALLGVTSSAATQVVNELERHGHVTKQVHPSDRRATVVVLTPKTRRAITAMRAAMLTRLSSVFAVLTDTELAAFAQLTKKVAARPKHS